MVDYTTDTTDDLVDRNPAPSEDEAAAYRAILEMALYEPKADETERHRQTRLRYAELCARYRCEAKLGDVDPELEELLAAYETVLTMER